MSIQKNVSKPGDGKNYPRQGQTVNVHYSGYLTNGTKFDSSIDRGQPFSFRLGVGQVIKGWDLGVASMSQGEIARFTIPSEFGYGPRGAPPSIPPNATLIFDVQLLSFN
jgi:FK506-binding protein 1